MHRLLRVTAGGEQHLRAAIQVNVFRGGNDHRALRRTGSSRIDRESMQAENAATVRRQTALGSQTSDRPR